MFLFINDVLINDTVVVDLYSIMSIYQIYVNIRVSYIHKHLIISIITTIHNF